MSSDDVWSLVQGRYDAVALARMLSGKSIAGLEMDGWTPLHYACDNRNVTSLAPLLAAGAAVAAADETGYTPLHLLCKNSAVTDVAVAELVKAGASVHVQSTDDKRVSPLHLLCQNDHIQLGLLQTLLAAPGADMIAVDGDGNTPLHYLAANHTLEDAMLTAAVAMRVTAAAQNQFKATALHYLCQNARVTPTMVHQMLRLPGASPNLPDNIGNSPLHALCENSRVSVALLRAFMSPDVPPSDTTVANSFGKRPFDSLVDEACVAFAQSLAPHHDVPLAASSLAGGEDVSDLRGLLLTKLEAWNASLPPFDDAFYVAICCEPAFEATYEHVQELSVALHDNPGAAPEAWARWEAQLAAWRKCVVLAFAALVHPSMWAQYAQSFHRPLPPDMVAVRAALDGVWKQYPAATDRRDRLAAIQALL